METLDYNPKHWEQACPKYECRKNKCKCGLKFVSIPAVLGDDSENSDVAPKNGLYCNTMVKYESNGHVYIYSKEGIPILVDSACCQSEKITKLTIKNLDTSTWRRMGESGLYMVSNSLEEQVKIEQLARVTASSEDVQFLDENNNTLSIQDLWRRTRNGEKFEITIPFDGISQKIFTSTSHPKMVDSQKVYLDNFEECNLSTINVSPSITANSTSYVSSAKVYVFSTERGTLLYDAPVGVSRYKYSDSTVDDYIFDVTIFVDGRVPEPE